LYSNTNGLFFFAPFAAKVKPNNSVEALGVVDDPDLDLMHKLEGIFGSEEFVSISFSHPDILSADALRLVEKISTELEEIEHIDKVVSLTRINDLKNRGADEIIIERLIREEWIQSGVPQDQRQSILSDKSFQRIIYNQEGDATSILAQFVPLGSNDAVRDTILGKVEKVITDNQRGDIQFHLMGMPVINRFSYGVVEKEQHLTSGIIILLVALIFWFLYRRLSLVVLPLSIIGMIMIWIMGLIYLTGSNFSWMLATSPVIILIVSICDSVHIINRYVQNSQLDKKARIQKVLSEIGLPCFLTSITTAVGFFAIATSKIMPLRDFGIFAGIGAFLAFLITVTLLPISLSFLKDFKPKKQSDRYARLVENVLARIHRINVNHGRLILGISLIVMIATGIGISRIVVETNILSQYKWGKEKINAANDFITSTVGKMKWKQTLRYQKSPPTCA